MMIQYLLKVAYIYVLGTTLLAPCKRWTNLNQQIVRLTWWKQQIKRIWFYLKNWSFLNDTSSNFSLYQIIKCNNSLFKQNIKLHRNLFLDKPQKNYFQMFLQNEAFYHRHFFQHCKQYLKRLIL